MIQRLGGYSYEDRLRLLDMPSLVYRRYRGDTIEVYTCLRGIYKFDSASLMPLSNETKPRGHGYRSLKRQCRGQPRSNCFQYARGELVEHFAMQKTWSRHRL